MSGWDSSGITPSRSLRTVIKVISIHGNDMGEFTCFDPPDAAREQPPEVFQQPPSRASCKYRQRVEDDERHDEQPDEGPGGWVHGRVRDPREREIEGIHERQQEEPRQFHVFVPRKRLSVLDVHSSWAY
jgi:hypothetical protein